MDLGINGRAASLSAEEIRKGLATKRLGKKIHYLGEIDSTNLYARKLAEEGAPEGEIVIAESQTGGKGRMGRNWFSPPNSNLYLSAVLRPELPPLHAAQITLMSAVALAETVQSFSPISPEIKWPNDILVQGRKLAGILTESSCSPERILFVILGIGVNLNFSREQMPASIQEKATSLMILAGRPVDRAAFTRRLIQDLDRCYGDLEDRGFSFMAERWKSFFHLGGKRVRVEIPDRPILGKALGIDGDGALLLEDDQGILQRILAGDVIPLES